MIIILLLLRLSSLLLHIIICIFLVIYPMHTHITSDALFASVNTHTYTHITIFKFHSQPTKKNMCVCAYAYNKLEKNITKPKPSSSIARLHTTLLHFVAYTWRMHMHVREFIEHTCVCVCMCKMHFVWKSWFF